MIDFLWENIFKKVEKEKSIRTLLHENILFQSLSNRELKFVENIIHIRHYRAGELIFRQGEIGVGMYLIASGTINILVDDRDTDPNNPKQILVTQLSKGDFFGEVSLVEENGKRSASAVANEDSILLGFFKPDLMEVAERNPSTGIKIMLKLGQALGLRLNETNQRITELRRKLKQTGMTN